MTFTASIYTITSSLHDEQAVNAMTKEFLDSIRQCHEPESDTALELDFKGNDYSDYGQHALELIYVRTGGTESVFKRVLPELQTKSNRPFYLLTSGKSNSLAASMEILSFLRQNGLRGEIIHGNPAYISGRIRLLAKVGEAKIQLRGCKLGIIGEPSDWLISSHADPPCIQQKLGVELVRIPMQELLDTLVTIPLPPSPSTFPPYSSESIREALPGACQIYEALKVITKKHQLQGFTLRCFDLLTAVKNTGCLALAKLNAEGIIAGCEGDVPALLSMKIAHALLGVSGFQANPASINPDTGEMLLAHCTIPFNMVDRYELDTHFESGIGIGIRGYMKEGPVTIFKVSGNLSRHFIEEGYLIRSQAKPDLCRTQQIIRLSDPGKTSYFLTDPIGNHHIILPGHEKAVLEEILNN